LWPYSHTRAWYCLIVEVPRSHTQTHTNTHTHTHPIGFFRTNDHLDAEVGTYTRHNKRRTSTNVRALSGTWTRNPSN